MAVIAVQRDLFGWARDSALGKITYFGLLFLVLEGVKSWTPRGALSSLSTPIVLLTIIGVFAGASVVAALGTLIIGWALRLGWKTLQIAWLVVRLLPAALRGLVFMTVGALVWLGELGRPQHRSAQISMMQRELQILSAKRRQETLAFATSMIASIEANGLGPDATALLADMLSRPGRPVSGKEQVISTLRRLLDDPDYLRPEFNSLESEWLYEKQAAEIVRPGLG